MQLPIRKKRPMVFHIKYWSMTILIEQATMYESIIFRRLLEQDRLQERWTDFIDNNTTIEVKRPYKLIPGIKKRIKAIVLWTQKELMQEVYQLWDLSYESVYTWVDMWSNWRKSLEWSEIVDVCGWDLRSALEIQKVCTREQYERMVDRVIFKSYEKSEETQKINDSMLMNKRGWLTEEQLEMRDFVREAGKSERLRI